jgi:NADPH2:quinone reductase
VVAGRVAAVGDGFTGCAAGDSVTALLAGFGGYATHVVVDAGVVVPLPVGVSAITAVAALESYGTAEFAVTERVTISPGEWVVVFGAGGGLGLAAVDVARGLGARVIGVASSEEKRSAARAAGAEIVLDYPDVKERIRAATQGGAHVVIDPVGGAAAEAGLRALRPGGRFCVLGFASGEIPRLPANLVLLGNRSVIGVDWGDRARTAPAATAEVCGRVLARIAVFELHPSAPTTFPLADAAQALRLLVDRAVTGKIALLP